MEVINAVKRYPSGDLGQGDVFSFTSAGGNDIYCMRLNTGGSVMLSGVGAGEVTSRDFFDGNTPLVCYDSCKLLLAGADGNQGDMR